jgi:hypothetical protein
LLASLEQQKNAGDVDHHLFQDGIKNEYSGRMAADERLWNRTRGLYDKAHLPHKYTHLQLRNQGIGLHQCQATEWMAMQYNYILMVEDDVVLSPHWLRLCRVLFEQFADWPRIFGFSPGFKKRGTNEDGLLYKCDTWFCEAFTAHAWRRTRIDYANYIRIIRGVDYIERDHERIRGLFAEYKWGNPSTSQDSAKDMALTAAGMCRVVCEVNRAISIGKRGIHMTPERFTRMGFENQTPYTHPGDATREQFDEPIDDRT